MVGQGAVVAFVGASPGDNIIVPLAGPGLLYYPFSNIATNGGFEDLSLIQFRFVAKTADFSFSLEEITLVPEPSTVALAGIAAAGLLRRRRRA